MIDPDITRQLNLVTANLRHLYTHLVRGNAADPVQLANGLLSPQIAKIESIINALK